MFFHQILREGFLAGIPAVKLRNVFEHLPTNVESTALNTDLYISIQMKKGRFDLTIVSIQVTRR